MVCLLTDKPEVLAQINDLAQKIGDEKIAYYALSSNNGFNLDLTPDGKPSILYKSLLDHYGDEKKALLHLIKQLFVQSKNYIGYKSERELNSFYKPYNGKTVNKEGLDLLLKFGEHNDTQNVILILLDHPNVNVVTKKLLTHLKRLNAQLIIHQGHKGDTLGSADFLMRLYSDVIITSSALETAETVAHEMLHLYLRRYYETHPEFKQELDDIQNKYRKIIGDSWYGTGQNEESDEFLNELFSNIEFRKELRRKSTSLWKTVYHILRNKIQRFLTGKPYKVALPKDLQNVLDEALNIVISIDGKNTYIGNNTLFKEVYGGKEFNRKDNTVNNSVEKIKKGIKQRLQSIKRYQNKNIENIQQTEKLLDTLNKLDSVEAIVEFVNYVNDNIVEAFLFLNENNIDINSKQLVQLKRDYLSFFIPAIKDIQYLTDTTDVLEQEIDDYEQFKDTVDAIVTGQTTLMNKYDNILRSKFRQYVQSYAEEAGSQTVTQMMNWIDDPTKDLNWLEYFIGQSSSANNEIIRIMADVLTTSINTTKKNTFLVGTRLVNILNKAKKANPNIDVMKLLLEVNSKGETTGYFTRDRNYGQFYKDQQEAIDKIVAGMNLTTDSDGVIQFESRELEKEFRKRKLKWQLKHGELKYKEDYYKAKFELSIEALDALNEIDQAIGNVNQKLLRNGILRLDKLTASDKAKLDALYRQKAELYSEYDSEGNYKSGIQLTIAKELQAFRNKLEGKIGYKTDFNKFNQQAAIMAKKFGVQSKEYSDWFKSATEEVYSEEFYKLLEMVAKELSKEDQDAINAYRSERSTLLKPYKDPLTQQVVLDLPDTIRAKVLEIDKKIAEINSKYAKSEEELQFKDIATIHKTKKYYEDMNRAKQEGTYEAWYNANHYEINGYSRIASHYTYTRPINIKYITSKPNKYFSIVDQSSEFVNENYDLNGEYIQPKKALYDNSTNYNKIVNNPTVKALYDELIKTMQLSNAKIAFLSNVNAYKLPLISGRTMSILARANDKFEALKYQIKDQFSIKDDDTDYVEDFEYRNDGSQIKLIPTRYVKMMDDPSKITSDVVGSVIQFFEMAENYNNMSEIQDDLEMILYGLEDLTIKTGRETKSGKDTNVYKKAADLLDMVLYGKKKNSLKVGNYNISKALTKVYNYVSLNNLANNVWAITSNYITGQGNADMEALLGKYFSASDMQFAKNELLHRLPDLTANIGNVNHKDKLSLLMLLNQVARSNEETFNRLDQSAILRGINQHFWYNGYSAGDFVVKSQLLMAVYHSYKYHNGEYLTKAQFISKHYSSDRKAGEAAFKALKETLWDAYDVVDGELKIVSTNRSKLVEKALIAAQKKITNIAVRIDGNITETDRAAIHRNAITLFLVMHRNFMINGFQERFKAKQFNYNTGEMEGGMYSDAVKFLYHSVRRGKLLFITQALADYKNLDSLEQYNVRKVLLETLNILIWTSLISTLFCALADDEPDEWALQALAYVSTRISFEYSTLYNPFELMNLLNSPSAAISTIENLSSYIKVLWIPGYFSEKGVLSKVKSGRYKGWPKLLRNFVKVTPIKNIYEATSVQGVKQKRAYLENQLQF